MPTITIVNLTQDRVSDEPEKDTTYLTFTVNEPIQAFTVNTNGTGHETGIVAHAENKYISTLSNLLVSEARNKSVKEIRQWDGNQEVMAEIHYSELYAEGENRINIYAQSLNGNWTPYQA